IRERTAIPEPERTGARALIRPGRLVGAPERDQHAQGRRLLWVPRPRGCLCPHGASGCVARRDGASARVEPSDDLLQRVRGRKFRPETVALDRGYDVKPVYAACENAG